ncbi:MAG: NYN domain-containing protein [Acidimicrobiales bacterium]
MKAHLPSTRRLHLVDIENLVGCPRPTLAMATACRDEYANRLRIGNDDLVVLACNHGAALEVGPAWPGCRLRVRSGPDGADRALLDVLKSESVEDRFGSVVIGSGDGCFTEAVAQLRVAGIEVTVAATAHSLSRRLALVASRVVLLDPTPAPPSVHVALVAEAA